MTLCPFTSRSPKIAGRFAVSWLIPTGAEVTIGRDAVNRGYYVWV